MSNNTTDVHHSSPIPISHHRRRSSESSSDYDSASYSSASPVKTPPALPFPPNPRIANGNPTPTSPSSATSPLLSYFRSEQSPTKSSTAFPFNRGLSSAVVEDDEDDDHAPILPTASPTHARRASTAYAGRFAQCQSAFNNNTKNGFVSGAGAAVQGQEGRGAGVLRRLSLSTPFTRPPIQASTTNAPLTPASPRRKDRLAAVNAGSQRERRAPSPMGERILKGHFDGFN